MFPDIKQNLCNMYWRKKWRSKSKIVNLVIEENVPKWTLSSTIDIQSLCFCRMLTNFQLLMFSTSMFYLTGKWLLLSLSFHSSLPSTTPFNPCPIGRLPTPVPAALINGPPPHPFPQLTRMILITIHLTFLVAGLTSMGSKGECLCLYRQGIPEDFIHWTVPIPGTSDWTPARWQSWRWRWWWSWWGLGWRWPSLGLGDIQAMLSSL